MAMSFELLLLHSDAVPGPAREALKAASAAPPEVRPHALESAARVLYAQTELDCGEVRDLVGLPPKDGCV
jgi:hypothetical protein